IAWKRAVAVLVNNEETTRRLPRGIREKCRVRTNACVDASVIPQSARPCSERPVAVCVGRLNRFKGVEIAIRAVEQTERWRLVIIGDGPDRRRLERLVERGQLGDRVVFKAPLNQAALWKVM